MTLADMIASARRKASDTAAPHLWSDTEWAEYANEAENEACRRARLITDSTTSAICSIAVVSGTASYALDSRIIFVRRVKLASKTLPTPKIMYRDLDEQAPGWESATGVIERYCLDFQKGKIIFYRNPTANDTCKITAVRAPLVPMTLSPSSSPEIPARFHPGLVNGMLSLAYLKEDKETLDPKKAEKYEGLFAMEFGPKSSAIEETWINERHGYNDDEGLF